MASAKIDRKIRFFPLFPWGFCSKHALAITGRRNPYSNELLLGENAKEKLAEVEVYRENAMYRAKTFTRNGTMRETKIRCGSPAKERIFRMLTREGLAALVELPEEVVEAIEEEIETGRIHDGNKKGTYCRSNSEASTDLREILHYYATSQDDDGHNYFHNLLLESVIQESVTPFSAGMGHLENIKISTSKYSQQQLYNIWRLSHIQAMFLVNNHLTYLDRRPYDTGFAIDGITDEESEKAYLATYGNTVAAFTRRTLREWYTHNFYCYQITQQQPDDREKAREGWLNTPAFYSTKELPEDPEQKIKEQTDGNLRGSKQRIYAIHVGLATGKNVNYACYHTKPGSFKWLPKREQNAKTEIEAAVRRMKTQCPEMRCKDAVDFALYFCPTHHQFINFFDDTIAKHKAGQKLPHTVQKPYSSIHVIPINDAGTFLLWCLLEYSPMEMENTIAKSLVEMDDDFAHVTNLHYPLTYKGKRVFLGHTMDLAKINYVLEDHLDGYDFYITCFPEQAPWYEKLFPGKTIL